MAEVRGERQRDLVGERSASGAAQSRRNSPFRSLRYPNFRLLLAAQMATSGAQSMEQVARGWLVYQLTGSALLLGLVQATRALPFLIFGVVGGAAADRFDRQRQLLIAQLSHMLLNLVLASLIVTDRVETWHIFGTAFLAGCTMAFQQPARQSLIPHVVDRPDIMNAITLNSGIVNGERTFGPAIAGLIIAAAGVGGSYFVQAALFLVASVWTLQLSVPLSTPRQSQGSMWHSIMEGFSYIRSNPAVLTLLVLALVPILLAQPYQALAPVFAEKVFSIGPTGLGILLSAPGVGAIIGAFVIAVWGDSVHKGLLMLLAIALFGGGLVGFALSPGLATALLALVVVGGATTSYRILNQTLLQLHTEDAYRGRVMSIHLLDRGFGPLGSVFAGVLAEGLGVRTAVAILGSLTAAVALITVAVAPRVRELS